jgi:hypothetical protein
MHPAARGGGKGERGGDPQGLAGIHREAAGLGARGGRPLFLPDGARLAPGDVKARGAQRDVVAVDAI